MQIWAEQDQKRVVKQGKCSMEVFEVLDQFWVQEIRTSVEGISAVSSIPMVSITSSALSLWSSTVRVVKVGVAWSKESGGQGMCTSLVSLCLEGMGNRFTARAWGSDWCRFSARFG